MKWEAKGFHYSGLVAILFNQYNGCLLIYVPSTNNAEHRNTQTIQICLCPQSSLQSNVPITGIQDIHKHPSGWEPTYWSVN